MPNLIHVSKGCGKLDDINSISTNTQTNPFCIKQFNNKKSNSICTKCYSYKSLNGYRKNMIPALQRNSDLFATRILDAEEIPKINAVNFRFSSHGELINQNHLINLVNIARANPQTNFALWSKQKKIVNAYFRAGRTIPDNLILVYSNSKIDKILETPPRHFHKTFNNVTPQAFSDRENCTGQQCKTCLRCYRHNGDNVIVEQEK